MADAPRPPLTLDAAHDPQAPAFSHPDHTPTDAALLAAMLREVQGALLAPPAPRPDRRLFLFHPQALRELSPLAFVGFRGERRPEVPEALGAEVERVDAELVARMSELPDVLGYSCWRLPDGNWINLVLLRNPEAVRHWHSSGLHQRASAQLSPQFYLSVRLHGGLLPGGVAGRVVVTRTRYYDFTAAEAWRAQRHFEAVPAR